MTLWEPFDGISMVPPVVNSIRTRVMSNECHFVSSHQQPDCLFNRLSNRISKKWSKQRTIGHLWEKFAGNSESTRAWWRYQMIIYSALLALCTGNSSVTTEFPSHRPVMQSFDVFFDLPLNKRLSKQSWGWWFEMQSRSLWRHCNGCKKPFHGMSSSYAWGILQLCNYMCNL